MNKEERFKMVSAMEFICRNLNDEDDIGHWLLLGVADGDIEYGKMCDDEFYIQDDIFADLMYTFLSIMRNAYKGGLYCDSIISEVKLWFM